MRAELYFVAELDDGEPNILVDGPFIKYSLACAAVDLQETPHRCAVVCTTLNLEQL